MYKLFLWLIFNMNIVGQYYRTKLNSGALKILFKQVVWVFNPFWLITSYKFEQIHIDTPNIVYIFYIIECSIWRFYETNIAQNLIQILKYCLNKLYLSSSSFFAPSYSIIHANSYKYS
jgi:hypothetical protein